LLLQLDPCNAVVLDSHLTCAAHELPLLPGPDGELFGAEQLSAAATRLRAAALLGRGPHDPAALGALHYTGTSPNPATGVSLRTIDPDRFIIYDVSHNTVLEEIEANMAFYEIYDGAIYLHQVCTSCTLGSGRGWLLLLLLLLHAFMCCMCVYVCYA
jgi:DEAD/DEAH box helicase domain-containing protein